jgi:hypothetical protein
LLPPEIPDYSSENLVIGVGAGFIPARSSCFTDLRAGINPAPTNNRFQSNLKLASRVLVIAFGTRYK